MLHAGGLTPSGRSQCRPTIGEIDEGEFKEGAWVNKAKVKGDVNKAAT